MGDLNTSDAGSLLSPLSFTVIDLEWQPAFCLPWPYVTRCPLEKIQPALLEKLPGRYPGPAAAVPEDKVNLYHVPNGFPLPMPPIGVVPALG